MAKPKPNDAEPVSLFPFLSILACLIGVLTFIITGVAISQMDQSEDLAAVERSILLFEDRNLVTRCRHVDVVDVGRD